MLERTAQRIERREPMRTVKGLRIGVLGGMALALVLLSAGSAQAQQEDRFTTERPGSILIFPKVVWTENRNTVIQITNTSNMMARAHCFYVNGAQINGVPLWQVTDFLINLTRQQPTHWSVCDGRPVNPSDDIEGLDPGSVPPVVPGFTGGLVCVQVNPDDGPTDANSLKGEATIGDTNGVAQDDSDGMAQLVSAGKYKAVAIQGINNDGDNVLMLDNQEYAGCPSGAHLNFLPEGSPDDVSAGLGNPAIVSTTLALMPCSMDFQNLVPASTQLHVDFRDEFEGGTSFTPLDVTCWRAFNLGDLPIEPGSSSTYYYARIEAMGASETEGVGFVGVANVRRVGANGAVSSATSNLHFRGNSDPGRCSIGGGECEDNSDCAGGGDVCVRNFETGVIRLPEIFF
jgi:hypothetical protein